ncbi:hypothetical protein F5890DRAFT_1504174 [Lentinula detonsa]|uniref:Uncharacterized protein n=1 Tax=Lentinula detonsa TaxID=2804962 RepID=A0AA38Q3B5_9AGAR|nr:hypothetical protein F5890DRAFT_1504174 [Lentinula detonsa]
MTWSWSPFALMLTMGVQIPRFRLPRRSLEVWILRTTALVSILASTLVVSTCRASPILAQPQPNHESHLTVLDSTNMISKGLFDDYDSHQDVPAVVGELHAVDTRHLRHHRGLGLRKKASQLSLAFDGMTLIGFAYTEALIGKEFDSRPIRLNSLTLPARRPTHPSTEYLYLIPKLGIESQNPKEAFWNCPVYASKSLMKENIPRMPLPIPQLLVTLGQLVPRYPNAKRTEVESSSSKIKVNPPSSCGFLEKNSLRNGG